MGCLLWWRCVSSEGYGIWVQRPFAHRLAHRVIYEECFGPIPEGYEVHHTCENKTCVQPEHLELVTRSEHQRIHRRKPYCVRGHLQDADTVHVLPSGRYQCRACDRERHRKAYREVAA